MQIFPRWMNRLPLYLLAGAAIAGAAATAFVGYYFSPEYTDVGYRPEQPVRYSHKQHAGDLGIDCRHCHIGVEISAEAMVPPTQTCMNCHKLILPDSENLLVVRESYARNVPIQWVRVHKLAEYAYFNHSAHVTAGVGCEECHGNLAQMEVVMQVKPLSMGWCLDCHRNPSPSLRPAEQVTTMGWEKPADHAVWLEKWTQERKIQPPLECSGCHR